MSLQRWSMSSATSTYGLDFLLSRARGAGTQQYHGEHAQKRLKLRSSPLIHRHAPFYDRSFQEQGHIIYVRSSLRMNEARQG